MRRLQTGLILALTTAGAFQMLAPSSFKQRLWELARAPVLNDVSTDLEDPPTFIVARQAPLPEAWKPRIQAAYPDLQPLRVRLAAPPEASPPPADDAAATAGPGAGPSSAAPAGADAILDTVTACARSMPQWEVVAVGPGLVVEAVATTRLLRFKDDVVVRVRPDEQAGAQGTGAGAGGGTGAVFRVDMRSRSRLGKGDLGANAARVRAFMTRLREELAKRGIEVL